MLIEGSNCREIIDNVTDMAHFFYIHFGLPTYFKNVFEGHVASQYLHNVGRPDINDLGTSYGEAHLDSEASYFGPSFMINWLHNKYGDYKAESILINCHYPVTQDSFMLQWGVIVEKPKGMDEKMTDKLSRVFTEGVSKGFLQDVEIWKHKTRIDNPLLVEEDGAVYQMRRWYQQFYVDVADVTPDMTDRFEIEVDTTIANEKWHVEVDKNLQKQAESRRTSRPQVPATMSPDHQPPDVDRLARSMLMLHGDHDSHDEPAPAANGRRGGSWSKASAFADDPESAAAVAAATQADRARYLTSGLQPVDCRFCHATVKSNGWGRDTLRCNGIPRHHSAAPISPSYALPGSTPRGRGPARKWATASNTQLPKGAWKRCPPRRPPVTAEHHSPAKRSLTASAVRP